MNVREFTGGTESMICPMDVGTVHHMQKKLCKLPKCLQRRIIKGACKKAQKMGFVVEPYAFFLFYEMEEPERIQKLLPKGFRPVKSRVFDGDAEKYYGITSVFRVHTSFFWGVRAEFYVVAENEQTGLMSWVILDYVSDTISYDYKNGLRSPEARRAVVSTTCEGELLADITRDIDNRRLNFVADLKNGKMRKLNEKLWIEGNTSIAYSEILDDFAGDLFSLTFLPQEMKEAWEIPVADVEVREFSWFPEAMGGKLGKAVCFPFAQHMLSDSPGNSTYYGNREALQKAAEAVDFAKMLK